MRYMLCYLIFDGAEVLFVGFHHGSEFCIREKYPSCRDILSGYEVQSMYNIPEMRERERLIVFGAAEVNCCKEVRIGLFPQ